jgi:(E)-4-hydroxy-3-methylbut-2-enyl-diphosphate synthase
MVGSVGVGGKNPIRLQSMTTTDTMDTTSSVEQAVKMIEAGCEIVRYTAPSKKEAENLNNIRQELNEKGYTDIPLVADIHFTPNAAEIAVQYVEKIRVNPGNYADKKKFEEIEYTDESYRIELERIRAKFTPLVLLCKEKGRAMRIGTNHGSLSDRIMSRFGDTPLGMVESALEFIQICEDNDYFDLVISMKSSNPKVMVQAYRLLVAKMMDRGIIYPVHLGVTEAGEGEDGRIKSAVGIGALLEDGIGDTIRVSLTERPEAEIPVAKMLAQRYEKRKNISNTTNINLPYNPFQYKRRKSNNVTNIGHNKVPVVVADLSHLNEIKPSHLFAFGYVYHHEDDKWTISELAVDYIYTGNAFPNFALPGTLSVICEASIWVDKPQVYPIQDISEYNRLNKLSKTLNFLRIKADSDDNQQGLINDLKTDNTAVLVMKSDSINGVYPIRRMFIDLFNSRIDIPVILNYSYYDITEDEFQLFSSTDFGALLLDGMGDGMMISAQEVAPAQTINTTAFGILQATRTRISKTEYISCPSCGRTLFDLEETTAKIRAKTNHLKGLKIGIMGCIVNGPGEMADADYGYVGVGKGKINLYKEKEVVKRNIPEEKALDELIELIKSHGEWVDL